jgi:serine protease
MTRDRAEAVVTAATRRLPYVPGEVLVKFRAGTDAGSRSRALSVLRTAPDEARWIGDVLLVRAASEAPVALAQVLERQPEVVWAQPNWIRRLHTVPTDPSYGLQQWNFEMIDLPRAWDVNPGANGNVIAAVIDTGVNSTTASYDFRLWTGNTFALVRIPFGANPDITAARIAPGVDFTEFWDGPPFDAVGHGTHVAGTVLQETNNALGFAGVAYKATLMPLRACFGYWEVQFILAELGIPEFAPVDLGGCLDESVAEALRYAVDHGAKIINLSLGAPEESPMLLDALRYAVQRGAFVAISAGNSFEEGNPTEYPAFYAAQLDGAVAVGAVGRSRRRAFYSSTGSHVELVAPGGDSRDGGPAGLVYQTGLRESDFDPETVIRPRFDRYEEQPNQGTSMAAPHVAGVAALLYSQGLRQPAAIEAALKRFARDEGAPGRDNEYGVGLIDARAALLGLGVSR